MRTGDGVQRKIQHFRDAAPKRFLGRASSGSSVALIVGQFASTLVVVPLIAVAASYSNLFMVFGGVAFALALPYLFGVLQEKYGRTSVSPLCVRQDS